MKKLFLIGSLIAGFYSNAQSDELFGIIAGTNEYYMGADFLSTRSGTGFTLGFANTTLLTDNSSLFLEGTYNRFNTEILGRQDQTSDPEWIKFNVQRINIGALYNYEIFHFMDDDLALGLCGGSTVSLLNDIRASDESKESYLLDPYYIEGSYLKIDENNSQLSVNVYITFGPTVRWRFLEGSLRYNLGITDPYRNFPATSQYIDFKGKDSYLNFQLKYYFGDEF